MVPSCANDIQGQDNNANFDIGNAVQCTKYKIGNTKYYMGPYCADQGGAIYLGFFNDDTCSEFADSQYGATTFESGTGYTLPYKDTNIVEYDCISCNAADYGNQNGQGVLDMCKALYSQSGKCEKQISSTYDAEPNNNACQFMNGVSITRKNGLVVQPFDAHANNAARISIVVFMAVFVLLSTYVYFLKSKLDRASIHLMD